MEQFFAGSISKTAPKSRNDRKFLEISSKNSFEPLCGHYQAFEKSKYINTAFARSARSPEKVILEKHCLSECFGKVVNFVLSRQPHLRKFIRRLLFIPAFVRFSDDAVMNVVILHEVGSRGLQFNCISFAF